MSIWKRDTIDDALAGVILRIQSDINRLKELSERLEPGALSATWEILCGIHARYIDDVAALARARTVLREVGLRSLPTAEEAETMSRFELETLGVYWWAKFVADEGEAPERILVVNEVLVWKHDQKLLDNLLKGVPEKLELLQAVATAEKLS